MLAGAIFFGLLGAAMGSFVDAVVWRLHTKRNFVTGRSECEHCHHKLGFWDLIPIFSWVALGGRCRYCQKPISRLAPLTELSLAVLFVVSYFYWPLGLTLMSAQILFAFWLVYLVALAILFVYDLRWQLLPDVIVFPLIGLGLVDAALRVSLQPGANIADYVVYVSLGVLVMAGLYFALYLASKGKWIGFGDIKLAVFMGAVLGWQKMLVVLMLANIIGLLVVLPGLLSKRLNAKSRVAFGPFMIVAFVIAGLCGDALIQWYTGSLIGLV